MRLFDEYNTDYFSTEVPEETPVEETPVEEIPVEETPVEETPLEETPVDESPVEDTPEEGGEDVGNVATEAPDVGNVLEPEEDPAENQMEIEEEAPSLALPINDDGSVPVYLGEEVTAAILATQPASGSLGASTLEYFDRIVSGLPADAVYVAYRNSSDDSYDGVLYYSQHYDIEGNSIIFGTDTREIIVDRVSSGNYNTVTNYYSADASYVTVDIDQDGSIIFYSNAAAGYPVLGGYDQSIDYSPFLIAALLGAFASVVLNKLLKV